MTEAQKVVEICNLLGLVPAKVGNLVRVAHNGETIGTMHAEAWLDHFRRCAIEAKRS